MYNQSYDEYIRSVLGYSEFNPNYQFEEYRNSELEDCYPEIYKIVYPMVKKRCQNLTQSIGKEKIDTIVEELYSNIESTEITKEENRNSRQSNNVMDIIKILLLRELLGRPNRPGFRPQFPPPPPGRPPFPPNRPQNSQFYRDYGDIYEY